MLRRRIILLQDFKKGLRFVTYFLLWEEEAEEEEEGSGEVILGANEVTGVSAKHEA